LKQQGKAIGIVVCLFFIGLTSMGLPLFYRSGFPYRLWKVGLYPRDSDIIEVGLEKDPQAQALFLGKTRDDLEAMLGNIHVIKGSFQLLVSKSLWPHYQDDHTYLRWGDRYIVFEMRDGRVIRFHFVHG
jgi:hypothetical protein